MSTDSVSNGNSYLLDLRYDLESVVKRACCNLSDEIRQQYDNVGDCDMPMIKVYIDYILYIFEYGVLQFDIDMSGILYITREHYNAFLEHVLALIPSWIVNSDLRYIFDVHMQRTLQSRGCYIEPIMQSCFPLPLMASSE